MTEKILKELQYQTKLLQDIYELFDESRHNSSLAKKSMVDQVDAMKKQMMNHPAIKGNPEMAALLNNMLSPIIKGEGK